MSWGRLLKGGQGLKAPANWHNLRGFLDAFKAIAAPEQPSRLLLWSAFLSLTRCEDFA
jgi:hypothetical protein